MPLKVAIISDLHCHHSSASRSETLLLSDLPRRPENQHPVSALDLLIKRENLRADVLLMPGDMANRADPQGISTAWDYITKMSTSLGATVLASTLGNHDVIWKTSCDDSFKLARDLLPQFPTSNEPQYEKFWSEGYYFDEQASYRILVINSVKHQTNEISAKRGLITTSQLSAIDQYLAGAGSKEYQIGLCHHHPIQHEEINLGPGDLMENGSSLVELLSRHAFSLLVHGHKHHPRLKIDSSGGNPLPILASGSFSAGMVLGLGTRSRNVFHIVELHSNTATTSTCKGTIKTWQFQNQLGWTEAVHGAAHFPHLAGFGHTALVPTLVDQVEAAFRALGKEVTHWSKIVQAVPEIEWVSPSAFVAVGRGLLERGIELSPQAPDRPLHIGIPV